MTALTDSIAASLIAQQGANVVIPEGYTSIANFAFSRKQLTSVSVPNSVTSIGDWAFEFSGLTSATIDNSVTSIGRNAFASNSLTNIIIPSSVTRIGNWAFEKNRLQSIAVPNGVVSIGSNAFDRNQLTSATIGNSVTSIGSFAFENNQLTRVVIPSSVTSIGSNAFDAGVIRVYLGRNNGNGTPAAITSSTPTVFQEGVTLTAPAVTGDPDGDATNPNYSYQWFKDGNAITGATTSTYAVPVTGAGTYKVAITYTDDQDFSSTVDSPNQDVLTGERILDPSAAASPIIGDDGIIDRFTLQTNSAPSTPYRISAFNPADGDVLQIPKELASSTAPRTFLGVAKVILPDRTLTKSEKKSFGKQQKAVSKSVKSIGRTGHGFAYNQLTGELFLDTNGKKKGFGLGGGLLAVLEDTPAIGIDNFQFL
jgi:hypothetical protein